MIYNLLCLYKDIYFKPLQQDPNSIKADHATLLSNKQDENSVKAKTTQNVYNFIIFLQLFE